MTSLVVEKRLAIAWLVLISGVLAVHPAGTFQALELYDHFLNNIAFRLMSLWPMIPANLAHNVVMAAGFALLALPLAAVPAALGLSRAWIAVAAILALLNVAWYYNVEIEVASATGASLARALSPSIIGSYLSNAIGALAGAYAAQRTASSIKRFLQYGN